jgi:hypothetical protein
MIITTVSFITLLMNWYNNRLLTTDQAIANHRHYCFTSSLYQFCQDLITTCSQFMVLILLSIGKCVFFCWFGACFPIKSNYIWIVPSKLSLGSLSYTNYLRSILHISSPYSAPQVVYPKNPSRSEVLYAFLSYISLSKVQCSHIATFINILGHLQMGTLTIRVTIS